MCVCRCCELICYGADNKDVESSREYCWNNHASTPSFLITHDYHRSLDLDVSPGAGGPAEDIGYLDSKDTPEYQAENEYMPSD